MNTSAVVNCSRAQQIPSGWKSITGEWISLHPNVEIVDEPKMFQFSSDGLGIKDDAAEVAMGGGYTAQQIRAWSQAYQWNAYLKHALNYRNMRLEAKRRG